MRNRIADLEWANYAATAIAAQVTPGVDVILRDDVIMTSSKIFPFPDANHACLLRATRRTVDGLIAKVVDYFRAQDLPATIFLSPACTPADLSERLLRAGFVKQEAEEAWIVLDHLLALEIPAPFPQVMVRPITRDDALAFAEIFMTAFDMPVDFAPYLAQLLEPAIDLPAVHHYIALLDEQPVGVMSLLRYEHWGVFGSGGVAPAHRRSGAATNLVIEVIAEAQKHGVDTLMGQTTAGTSLERLLRIIGFERAFTRTCYTLPNERAG